MTRITSLDLQPFYRTSIGVDRLFDRILSQMDTAATNNYPPYNILKITDTRFELQLAVAGFRQGDLEITVKDGVLTIQGQRNEDLLEGQEYLYHGIGTRRFSRTWPLGEYVEVREAAVENGILTVTLEQVLPENARPKTIAITYKNT
jgi:molecular chaperone IbpA